MNYMNLIIFYQQKDVDTICQYMYKKTKRSQWLSMKSEVIESSIKTVSLFAATLNVM